MCVYIYISAFSSKSSWRWKPRHRVKLRAAIASTMAWHHSSI